jgi:hypothetical protein
MTVNIICNIIFEKGMIMMDDEGFGLSDFLRDLLAYGYLEGDDVAEGIVRQVIDRGIDSLSPKQQWVYENRVESDYIEDECKLCHATIPWEEKIGALDNGGLCGWCQNLMEKDD